MPTTELGTGRILYSRDELDSSVLAERYRCCRAVCRGCREEWPIVNTPWCEWWHSDDPDCLTSGMHCMAVLIHLLPT